jgi:hypothetical protein
LNCGDCKRPCNYPNADWFPPNAIKFCRLQVLFYLKDCDSIRQGEWPKEPNGSSYTDPAIRSAFVKIPAHNAEMFAAEMDCRLKMCGIEGKLLEYEVKLDYQLSPSSYKALNFISGWRRRTESWRSFKSRQKTYKMSSSKNDTK